MNDSFIQLSAEEANNQLKVGDVALVRSENVNDLGDHYIIITGGLVQKDHGIRAEEVSIHAPETKDFLDTIYPINGLTLLKLEPVMACLFLDFHDIKHINGKIIFPSF